jgi:hypothetical protein
MKRTDEEMLRCLDAAMPSTLQRMINNAIGKPKDVEQLLRKPHVEIDVADHDGNYANTLVVVSVCGGKVFGAFWKQSPVTVEQAYNLAAMWGAKHQAMRNSGYDVEDSIAGCMAFPKMATQFLQAGASGDAIVHILQNYQTSLKQIFEALSGDNRHPALDYTNA